eukprot:6203885-Pleurochrysis_carterae.AAC.2
MSAPARVSPLPAVKGLPRLDYLIKLRTNRATRVMHCHDRGERLVVRVNAGQGWKEEMHVRQTGQEWGRVRQRQHRRVSWSDVIPSPPMETGRRGWYIAADMSDAVACWQASTDSMTVSIAASCSRAHCSVSDGGTVRNI